MLAKLWKKVLLAICIIACLFNITSKLVNRHSLKENLQSVNDGETIFDLSGKKDSSSNSGKDGAGGSNGSSGANNGNGSDASNGMNSGSNGSENPNHVIIYDDDGNIVDEYDVDDNSNGYDNGETDGGRDNYDNDNYDGNNDNDGNNGDGREINIDVREAANNVKEKVSNIDVDVEPVEAPEVYHDVPVYEEGDPQRENANNSDYKFTIRDFFGLFKAEEKN